MARRGMKPAIGGFIQRTMDSTYTLRKGFRSFNASIMSFMRDYTTIPLTLGVGYLLLDAQRDRTGKFQPFAILSQDLSWKSKPPTTLSDDDIQTSFQKISSHLKRIDKTAEVYWNSLTVGVDSVRDQLTTTRRKVNDLYDVYTQVTEPENFDDLLEHIEQKNDYEKTSRIIQIKKLREEDAFYGKLDAEYREHLSRSYAELQKSTQLTQEMAEAYKPELFDHLKLTTYDKVQELRHAQALSGIPYDEYLKSYTWLDKKDQDNEMRIKQQELIDHFKKDERQHNTLLQSRFHEFKRLGYPHLVEEFQDQPWDALMGPIHNTNGDLVIPPSTYLPPDEFDRYIASTKGEPESQTSSAAKGPSPPASKSSKSSKSSRSSSSSAKGKTPPISPFSVDSSDVAAGTTAKASKKQHKPHTLNDDDIKRRHYAAAQLAKAILEEEESSSRQ